MSKKTNTSSEKPEPSGELRVGWSWLDSIIGNISEDYFADGREQPPSMQERPELDQIFE
jgi:hypothetical protein